MKTKTIILFGVLLLAALPLFAPVDFFMKIEGIQGESTKSGHQGWIELNSFSFGTPQTSARMNTIGGTESATGGAGAGKASFHEFTITKTLDKASAVLFRACAAGKHFPTVTLDLNGERYLLQDVVVTSAQKAGAMADGSVREVIKISFARDVTHESPGGANTTDKSSLKYSGKIFLKYESNGSLAFSGGAPGAIMLQDVRLIGQNQAIIVVCDVGGGQALAGLQRAFQMRQKLPELMITAKASDATHKQFSPAVQFTFTNVLISGNTPTAGGCNQFSLNFTKFNGPLSGFHDVYLK
jgi:type VI secretion system secreted protein Hcp